MATVFLVGAAVVMATGAAIPFFAPALRDAPWSDDWAELAGTIAGNPAAWRWANALFLAAAVLTTLGLIAFSARVGKRGRQWAYMAATVFAIAAVLEVVGRLIAIGPATWAAEQHIAESDVALQAFIRLDEALLFGFFVFGFVSVMLCGAALWADRADDRSGAVYVGAGAIGVVLAVFGTAIPAFVYVATAALGVSTSRLHDE